jgi:hypothetical protein
MWIQEKQFAIVPVAEYAAKAASSFKEFPPRGVPANYSLDAAVKLLNEGSSY